MASYQARPGAVLGKRQQRGPDIRNTRLTARQRAVLDAIHDSFVTRGYAPTHRELGEAVGITSTNATSDHLDRLEAKGFIERPGPGRCATRARTLKLTPLALALYAAAIETAERSRERETDPGSVDEGEA